MVRRPPISTRTDTLSLHDALPICEQLVDIHSQHQTRQLNAAAFQLFVVDGFAGHQEQLDDYRTKYRAYRKAEAQLRELEERSKASLAEADYLQFQFDELENARLQPGEQDILEQELLRLTHAEEIKRSVSGIVYLLEDGEAAVADQLKEAGRQLGALEKYSSDIAELNQRLNS